MHNLSTTSSKSHSIASCASKSYRIFSESNFFSIDSSFIIDRRRVVKSMAFRRLGYKTQAFANAAGDHYRTRLTHSLEVAQISRLISQALHINMDLAETIALAHDLGHPPFGHAGEAALHQAAAAYDPESGFDHNAHTLRILVFLEQVYPDFDGLNLTWDTIEGLAKHNGPLKGKYCHNNKVSNYLLELSKQYDLKADLFPSLEAQVAGLADDIAYCNHDLDDGIRAGFFTFEDMQELQIIWKIICTVDKEYPSLAPARRKNEIVRRLTYIMIEDVIKCTQENLLRNNIKNIDDVRQYTDYLVKFSPPLEELKNSLKAFLRKKVYNHYEINRGNKKAQHIVGDLFNYFINSPECLPAPWISHYNQAESANRQTQVIVDYIAGMTDRYAIKEHRKLFA